MNATDTGRQRTMRIMRTAPYIANRCFGHSRFSILDSRISPFPASGFTLIEVLVVAAVIALLAAVLLPSLARVRALSRSALCLNNLRQMAVAANEYTHTHEGRYPPAYFKPPPDRNDPDARQYNYAWDFTEIRHPLSGSRRIQPGLLWQGGKTIEDVHRCPDYKGGDNWAGISTTGYNYNTSYVGTLLYHVDFANPDQLKIDVAPARTADVKRPDRCVFFGDGEFAGGANKFMRSPWGDPADGGFEGPPARDLGAPPYYCGRFPGSARHAGTQGYRHLEDTNVAMADGHAQSWRSRNLDTYPDAVPKIANGTGFLTTDNRLYDLD